MCDPGSGKTQKKHRGDMEQGWATCSPIRMGGEGAADCPGENGVCCGDEPGGLERAFQGTDIPPHLAATFRVIDTGRGSRGLRAWGGPRHTEELILMRVGLKKAQMGKP